MCKRRDPDLGGEAGAGSLREVSLAFCLPLHTDAGRRAAWRESRGWLGGQQWKPCLCCGSLWPEAGFLPLWMSVMVGVTPGCLSVYAVYFIKELEQSRQDFSSCLSSQWSH